MRKVDGCGQCGATKPRTPEFFYKATTGAGGLSSTCKECAAANSATNYLKRKGLRREQTAAWRKANPAKVAGYIQKWRESEKGRTAHKAWVEANREKVRGYVRASYQKLAERRLAESAEYRAANPEKFKAYRAKYKADGRTAEAQQRYKEAHREELNERGRRRYAKLDKKVIAEYAHRRRVQIRGVSDGPVDLAAILAIYGMVCHLCGEAIPEGDLHFDHVIPLSKGGHHSMDNIKPAHGSCNRRKSAKVLP